MAVAWFRNSASPTIKPTLVFMQSAKAISDDIEHYFMQGDAPCKFALRKAISEVRQDDLSVAAYFNLLKDYWEELSTLRNFKDYLCTVARYLGCCL